MDSKYKLYKYSIIKISFMFCFTLINIFSSFKIDLLPYFSFKYFRIEKSIYRFELFILLFRKRYLSQVSFSLNIFSEKDEVAALYERIVTVNIDNLKFE